MDSSRVVTRGVVYQRNLDDSNYSVLYRLLLECEFAHSCKQLLQSHDDDLERSEQHCVPPPPPPQYTRELQWSAVRRSVQRNAPDRRPRYLSPIVDGVSTKHENSPNQRPTNPAMTRKLVKKWTH